MKKSLISLGLIGLLFLVVHPVFAQDAPPVNEENSATVNQVDSNSPDSASAPADTQANSDNSGSNSDNQQSNTENTGSY